MFTRKEGFKTYRVILNQCGKRTRIAIWTDIYKKEAIIEIPYSNLRNELKGTYIVGVGYVIEMDYGELLLLGEKFSPLIDFIGEFMRTEDFILSGGSEYQKFNSEGK